MSQPDPTPTPGVPIDALIDALSAMPPEARVQRLRASGDPAPQVESIAQHGADLAIGDTLRGERTARLSVELADALGIAGLRARARVALAHVLNYATRFEEALDVLAQADGLASRGVDRFAASRGALISMHALARLGRMEEAVAAGQRAVDGFEALGEPVWRAKADVNVGVLRRMRDDPEGALSHFDAARPAFAQAPAVLAQVESNRAEALLDLGRFAEAERAFAACLQAFKSAGIARAAAIAEGNLADLLGRQGRLESSLEHFERARRSLESADAPADLARLRAEEADALASVGMHAESASAYRAALVALDQAGLAAESARARVGFARVLSRLGRIDDAATTLDQAIAQFERIPNPTGAARAGVLLARLRLGQGRTVDASDLLARHAPSLADRPAESLGVDSVRAAIAADHADPATALATLDAAVARARTLGMRPSVVDLLQQRAEVKRRAGDLSGCIDDLTRAIDVAELIRSLLQADRLRAAASGDRADLYAQLLDALLDRSAAGRSQAGSTSPDDDQALAFETADRGKARSLLDLVQANADLAEQLAAGDPEADPALVGELQDRRRDMNAIYSALFAPHERRLTAQTQQRLSQRLDDHERRVAEIERRLATTRRFQALHAPHVSIKDLRAVLRPDEALIEYFGAGGHLGAAVVTPEGLGIRRRLATLDETVELGDRLSMALDRAVISLSSGTATRGQAALGTTSPPPTGLVGQAAAAPSPGVTSPQTERLLRRVYDLALAPLEHALGQARRVLIVPHGPLHAMPLHAAIGPRGPLVASVDIAYAPSAALLVHARHRHDAAPAGPSLVVGVPDEIAPEMGDEARAVSAALPGSRLLLGADATFDAFAQAAPRAPLIHLACHGVFAPRNPMQARLRFADRWVTVRDLLPLALRGSRVVLSACESGRAGVERGDETFGLGRALLAAGASAAVLGLWPVHDRTTRHLMISVYQRLNAGYLSAGAGPSIPHRPGPVSDLAGALAAAHRELLAAGTHPAIWAPFVVVGDPGS